MYPAVYIRHHENFQNSIEAAAYVPSSLLTVKCGFNAWLQWVLLRKCPKSREAASDVLNYLSEFAITEFWFISLPLSSIWWNISYWLNLRAKFLGSTVSGFSLKYKGESWRGQWCWVDRGSSVQWFWESVEIRSQIAGNK